MANRSQTARSEHSLLINKLIKKGDFVQYACTQHDELHAKLLLGRYVLTRTNRYALIPPCYR